MALSRIVSEIQINNHVGRDPDHSPSGGNLSSVSKHSPKTICLWNFKCIALSIPKILRVPENYKVCHQNDLQISLKVIRNDMVWQSAYDFLLAFHSNYDPISHRFQDTLRYCLKISNFWYPNSIWRPRWGWFHKNFTAGSLVGKLEWWGYQMMKKVW